MIFFSERDYYITGVKYNLKNEKKLIEKLQIAKIEGNTIKKQYYLSKLEVVNGIMSGKKNYYTLFISPTGKLTEGSKVILHRKNHKNYLILEDISNRDNIEEDNLGNLPEL